MKHTALILAGAAVFDLGVMAVAAQAQQGTQAPTPRSTGPVSPGQAQIGAAGQKTAEDLAVAGPTSPGSTSGAAVWDPTGTGGCTPGSPLSGGTANPCAPGGVSTGKHFPVIHIKIDQVNTIQSCASRRGEVVRHEGVQQCRLPAPAAPVIGNRRPGASPPRN